MPPLPVVGTIINTEAGDPRRLSRPEVALPAADPLKAEIVELDVAIMVVPDVPEQHRLAKAIIRRLAKVPGQGTAELQLSNHSATICQLGMSLIRALRSDAMPQTMAGFASAVRALQPNYSRTRQVQGCRRASPTTH
jgi:hypothetical protein